MPCRGHERLRLEADPPGGAQRRSRGSAPAFDADPFGGDTVGGDPVGRDPVGADRRGLMTDRDREPALDPAAIQQLLDMTGGDAAFLEELLQSFLDGAEAAVAELRRAAVVGSAEDV